MLTEFEGFGIFGIGLEILGFIFILKSTKLLKYAPGIFHSSQYVDKKTGKPPEYIESAPKPRMYRPGIVLVIIGLGIQIVQIVVD